MILKFDFAVENTPHHQTLQKFYQLLRRQKPFLAKTQYDQYQIRLIVLISVFQVRLGFDANLESLMIVTQACQRKFFHLDAMAY